MLYREGKGLYEYCKGKFNKSDRIKKSPQEVALEKVIQDAVSSTYDRKIYDFDNVKRITLNERRELHPYFRKSFFKKRCYYYFNSRSYSSKERLVESNSIELRLINGKVYARYNVTVTFNDGSTLSIHSDKERQSKIIFHIIENTKGKQLL